jgi:curved DNA-binding protein CbpA
MKHLYEVLGVNPASTQSEIKAAYRARAKTLHPDKGGSVLAFAELSNAYEVLSDPEKRAAYDNDGTINGEHVGQENRQALTFIDQLLEALMQGVFQSAGDGDPIVTSDLAQALRNDVQRRITELAANIEKHKRSVTRMKKFAKRFKSKGERNVLRTMVDYRVRQIEGVIPNMREALKVHEAALEILEGASFDVDAMSSVASFGGFAPLGQNPFTNARFP